MSVFLCMDSCHALIFALWQEGRVAGELAIFLLNEKPSVKTTIRMSASFLSSLSESNIHNRLRRKEHQLWKDQID